MNFFAKKLLENLERNVFWCTFASVLETASRGGAVVARWAHNPKAGGSIPSPATITRGKFPLVFLLYIFFDKTKLKVIFAWCYSLFVLLIENI